MTTRFTTGAIFVAALTILVPATARARTVTGRVTTFSPTSISVFDTEVVTVGIDNDTTFTRLVTQKAWQQDTALAANALRVGSYVVVHVPDGNPVANWVQVATDFRVEGFVPIASTASLTSADYNAEAARHQAEATARRAAPTASESKRPGAPDTALHCERLAAQARKAAVK